MNDKKSPGRPRSARAQEAILKATLALLGEVGYEAMSIEAIAARARVGKATIYRRYRNKEELVADAIESIREEVFLPNTGSLATDLTALVERAAQISLTPLGRQAVAMILSSAASNPAFAQLYWEKYLEPRRSAFAAVIDRAKQRGEVVHTLDPGLVFDMMSGIMLYAMLFPPASESWSDYVGRTLNLLFPRVDD